MTKDEQIAELRDSFFKAYPKAVDFQEDLESLAVEVAPEYGYRMAGKRLGRVVFTTKPAPTNQ